MTKIKQYFQLILDALKGKEHDFTQGSLRSAVILLSIPMILELSMESVFAIVDMYFVGKLGANAIAVVGYTESVMSLVYSMAIGLSAAATALIARRIGEKRVEEASRTAANVLIIGMAVTIFLSTIGYIFSDEVLVLMGATDEVVKEGQSFTKFMFLGTGSIVFIFLINGLFRGAGNAALAMHSLWIASILNIILDPIFIYGIGDWQGFGLEGAAIATVIGRSVGIAFQCYHLFFGRGLLKLHFSFFKPAWDIIRSTISLAYPATIQFLIASGSWIFMTKLVAETGGPEASAGYQIAIRNMVFFILPAWGFSNAAATLVGQHLGAKMPDRAAESVYLTTKFNVIFMAFVMTLFVFFPEPIVGIFTKETTVADIGVQALRIMGSGFIFYGIGMVMMQALNGAGDTQTPTWINFICFWLIQIPVAYTGANYFEPGYTAVFWAVPLAETLIAIVAWQIFKKGRWKKIQI